MVPVVPTAKEDLSGVVAPSPLDCRAGNATRGSATGACANATPGPKHAYCAKDPTCSSTSSRFFNSLRRHLYLQSIWVIQCTHSGNATHRLTSPSSSSSMKAFPVFAHQRHPPDKALVQRC